jgi:hypothetical protein
MADTIHFGVDTINPVTQKSLDHLTNDKKNFTEPPCFWARYFHSVAVQGKKGQFDPATESKILCDAGILLLPIARQTTQVAGDEKLGAAHGKLNVEAVKKVTSDVTDTYLFLDVEDDPHTKSPAMSAAYWTGWSNAVADAKMLPCLYVMASSVNTFKALKESTDGGAPFEVLWIARWQHKGPKPVPASFDPMSKYLKGITDLKFDPQVLDPKQHIVFWQYANGDLYDYDAVNPSTKPYPDPLQFLIQL